MASTAVKVLARSRERGQRLYQTRRQLLTHTTALSSSLLRSSTRQKRPASPLHARSFHNYFVTHLPSSSMSPDSRSAPGLHHKLPRAASAPHTAGPGSSAPVSPPNMPSSRDTTVVRIPLRSAKHHFGACSGRGSRPYNEDTNTAGTIDIPAFAKRAPMNLVRSDRNNSAGVATTADSPFGDPQVFYFGVFDGHGGTECSEFLRDELHGYIEEAANEFGLQSSLRNKSQVPKEDDKEPAVSSGDRTAAGTAPKKKQRGALDGVNFKTPEQVTEKLEAMDITDGKMPPATSQDPVGVKANVHKALKLEKGLVTEYKNTIGGYFRRFKPTLFDYDQSTTTTTTTSIDDPPTYPPQPKISIESVLTYAFLRADLDFVTAQARKPDRDDPSISDDQPLNRDEILGSSPHSVPSGHTIGGPTRFQGGSTASVALISTPTPAPFWHPNAHSTVVVAHVGDTRILLCATATGLPLPLTSDHHPSSPTEARRLTRFAESSLTTDSFGEERISGLANSRAFGDMRSKRIGVSAEPALTRRELGPAQFSFMVLVSDGVSGTLSDQEIVDVIKEARTPEEGARAVVGYATEVSSDGDNATCLVVRLGGWERRSEGGLGSLGTKEMRDARRADANDPRRGPGR
ncbi:unnamed protein product [Discula destructiva]